MGTGALKMRDLLSDLFVLNVVCWMEEWFADPLLSCDAGFAICWEEDLGTLARESSSVPHLFRAALVEG